MTGTNGSAGPGGERWKRLGRRKLLDCGIFAVVERENEAPDGRRGRFIVLEAPDWATVVPMVEGAEGARFLMVRQYRHGSDKVSVEFPGGVVEKGEEPAAAAERELEEETGYRAASIVELGWTFPNPAFMDNRHRVFLARGCEPTGSTSLDEHELIDAFLVPAWEVEASMGRPPYSHALMAAALFMALRELRSGAGGGGKGKAEVGAGAGDGAAPALRLEAMRETEYAAYREHCVDELARATAAARGIDMAEARELAAKEQDEVLPEGASTKGQRLYTARSAEDGRRLGRVWFGDLPGGGEPGVAFIFEIDVSPDERGRGAGMAILAAAEAEAGSSGYRAMRLWVAKGNIVARALYSKAGFSPIRGDAAGDVYYKAI